MGLWYPKEIRFTLKAFADADYAGCHDTRRSTSGSAQFLGHRLVKGRTVADSIAERLKRPTAYKFRQIAVSLLSWYN
ncbi:hypothetical protein Tco_0965069 [Tanacetum coccineum]